MVISICQFNYFYDKEEAVLHCGHWFSPWTSSAYIWRRSRFSLGFTLIHWVSHLPLHKVITCAGWWSAQVQKMETCKDPCWSRELFIMQGPWTLSLNTCWTVRGHWISAQFKSKRCWQIAFGAPVLWLPMQWFTNHKLKLTRHSLYTRPCAKCFRDTHSLTSSLSQP